MIFQYFKKGQLIVYIMIFILSSIEAQEAPGTEPSPAAEELPVEEEDGADVPDPEIIKLSPVLPVTQEGLVFIEGESAVSTNFATSAVYNYGASGYKALQLIQQNTPYGGQAYFAEYAFYVEEDGEYAFWYGGTPPGPQDTVFPSFASSFRYILDDGEPVTAYREDVAVVEAYTPSYYWMEVEKMFLTKGVHRIRFEVPEKRRYDGRYYFFIDAFFFLRADLMEAELPLAPDVFPMDRTNRSIDNPFQSISYYQTVIKDNPDNKNAYIVLSLVYSLLGDYINSIQNLNKAVSLDPEDPYPLLLTAKNRIWNGEISEGLTVYRQLVTLAPNVPSYWAEAGKVAAWTGNYRDSIEFFTKGLERFPDNLNLKVNLGLTYLWMARNDDADTIFKEAGESAAGSHDKVMELGKIQTLNGYPGYAEAVYKNEIEQSPEYLETYLALEDAYRQMGESEKAEAVIEQIYETFETSDALVEYMRVYDEKINMKNGILQDYIDALAEQPDNVPLRQLLSQTYFWNGMKDEAVDQSLRILVNKLYLYIRDFDTKSSDLLSLMDRFSRFREKLGRGEEAYHEGAGELDDARSAYEKVQSALEKSPDDEGLREEADRAEAAYAEAFDTYSVWTGRMAELDREKETLLEEWEALKNRELSDEETFRQLLGESQWTWDRSFTRNELQQVQRDEPFLAGYVLSRLALFSGRSGEAVRYLRSDVFEDDAPSRYGLYEGWLWSRNGEEREDMWEQESDVLTLYKQHLFDMEAALWTDEGAGGYMIPLSEDTDALISEIEGRRSLFREDSDLLDDAFYAMRGALDQQLVRQIYYYEQETYMLRYSLGEFYLDMEQNLKAVSQFERVLAVDPWNISANYKLGIVSQRAGDWSRAMSQYKKVYYQNPNYENASYYYNQLARQNADVFRFSAQNITDTSRINYRAKVAYDAKINSRLGWGFSYNLDMDRRYKGYTDTDGDSVDYTVNPSQYKMHSFEFNVPVTFPDLNLTVTPLAGFYIGNSWYGDGFKTTDSQYIVSPDELFSEMIVKPLFGVSAGWNWSFLNAEASYRYQLERESMFPDRELARSHFISLDATNYFPLEQSYDWGPAISRTYSEFEFLTNSNENNLKWQLMQEGSLGVVVSRSPLIRLTGNALLNFEDGSDTEMVIPDYYLPDGVMELKGGLRGTINFHNSDYTRNLEMSLYGAVGGYWVDVLDQGENLSTSLKAESYFSVYYVKEIMMLYLNIGGSTTFKNAQDLNFWEFSAELGARISVPSLLTN